VERIKERYEDAKSLLSKFDARYRPVVPPKWEVNLALTLTLTATLTTTLTVALTLTLILTLNLTLIFE